MPQLPQQVPPPTTPSTSQSQMTKTWTTTCKILKTQRRMTRASTKSTTRTSSLDDKASDKGFAIAKRSKHFHGSDGPHDVWLSLFQMLCTGLGLIRPSSLWQRIDRRPSLLRKTCLNRNAHNPNHNLKHAMSNTHNLKHATKTCVLTRLACIACVRSWSSRAAASLQKQACAEHAHPY